MAYDFSNMNHQLVDTFGSTITHIPQSGPTQTDLSAIIDDPSILLEAAPGVLAVVHAELHSFNTAPARNDGIQIGSNTYRVIDVAEDATDFIRLSLTK